jgi:ATP-dependent helicase/nuclease subunit A
VRRSASPHRLVRASAGSGKTFQLTNALIALLLRGEEPSAILATTFTKAAAGEILHRTLARLSAAVVDETSLAEIRLHCEKRATAEGCAATLDRVIRSLDRLSVMTIDAFFHQLAGAHALEIGLAPGWRVLDEDEESDLQALAVERALERATEAERIELLAQLQGEKLRQRAHHELMEVVRSGYETFLSTDEDGAAWERVAAIGRELSDAERDEALSRFLDLPIPTTAAGKPRAHYVKAREAIRAAVQASDPDGFFGASSLVSKCIEGETTFARAVIPDEMREALAPLIEHARRALTADHAARTLAARRFLERFDDEYSRLKQERGVATFADPPRLLARSLSGGALETLYYRLDARIRHVLLDEFQDTSMSQFGLLAPMLDELLSQADGRSVFCVGDVKQSLYSWRGAEPELLGELGNHWPAFEPSTLSVSWRSAQPVLDAVNEVFSRLPDHPSFAVDTSADATKRLTAEAARDVAASWRAWFEEGPHEAAKEDLPGYARLSVAAEDYDLAAEDGTLSRADADRAALKTVVDRVKEIQQEAAGASIAVIVRRGKDLRTVLHALKQAKVDASEERGSPLADSPVVAAAVSLLRLIDHPGDSAARFHVCSTPLGRAVGLTRASDADGGRAVARRLRREIARRGLAATLLDWKRRTASAMDERGAARFDQLIEAAADLDREATSGASDLARVAEERRVEEAGGARVRVMTIHKSKGLEYDAVVVPMLATNAWGPSASGYLATRDDPLGPITRATRYPSERLRAMHPELREMFAQQHRRGVNEELCCLYVAMTRARRRLEIIVPADKAGRNAEALEPEAFRLCPAHIVRGALAADAPATPSKPETPAAALWEAGDARAWSNGLTARAPAPEREIVRLRVVGRARRSAGRLATASPSGGADGSLRLRDVLGKSDRAARTHGSLMHRWLEMIEWLDEGTPSDSELIEVAERDGYPREFVGPALESLRAAMASEEIRAALSKGPWLAARDGVDGATALRERGFAMRRGEGRNERMLRGQIDRLVLGMRGGRVTEAEVVDFKTDARAAEMSDHELLTHAESHRAQLEAYREAAARQLGLPVRDVSITLVFLAAGRVVPLSVG